MPYFVFKLHVDTAGSSISARVSSRDPNLLLLEKAKMRHEHIDLRRAGDNFCARSDALIATFRSCASAADTHSKKKAEMSGSNNIDAALETSLACQNDLVCFKYCTNIFRFLVD